jgi:hypothetical protein
MKPEEIRIAIAEACGWTGVRMSRLSEHLTGGDFTDYCGIRPGHTQEAWREVIPDYLSDLNAMHEAIMAQPPYIRVQIFEELVRKFNHPVNAFISEASDWAEAYLKVLNLWKET